jgi:hypothetical protein
MAEAPGERGPRGHRLAVGLLFGVAVLTRALFLTTPALNSDQAVIGLMGRHVLAGEFPVFFWGEPTSGSIESLLAAAVFQVGGASRLTLNLVPALLSLGFVWAGWRLGREVAGERAGLFTLALLACPPVLLTWNSVLARGNYVENLGLGTVCLLLATRLGATAPGTVASHRLALLLGGVAGLAWYTSPQSIHYLVAVSLYLAWRLRLAVLGTLRHALPAFLVGSLPFWLANGASGFASFDEIRRYSALMGLAEGGRALAGALPVLAGAAGFADMPERLRFLAAPLLGPLAGSIAIAGLVVGLGVGLRRRPPGAVLLGLLLAVTGAVILLGGVLLSDDGRYLLPLYSGGVPLLAAGLAWCWRWRPALAGLALAVTLGSNAYGHVRFLAGDLARVAQGRASDTALLDFLEARGMTRVFAPDYWLSYRLTFDAAERVVVALPFWGRHPRALAKYPEYTERVRALGPSAYVLTGKARPLVETLRAAGIAHQATPVGRYTVLHDFAPPPARRGLPSSAWRSDGPGPWAAFDRDPWTSWRGARLSLDLGAVLAVSQVSLVLGPTAFEPVGVRILGSHDGVDWTTLGVGERLLPGLGWAGAGPLLEEHGRVALAWPAQPVRHLRIERAGGPGDLSLAEVFVSGPAPAVPAPDLVEGHRLEAARARGDALERYAVRLLDDPDDEAALVRLLVVAGELGLGGLDAAYDALAARTVAADPRRALRFARQLFAVAAHRESAWRRLAQTLRASGQVPEAEAIEAGRHQHFTPGAARAVSFGRSVQLVGYDLLPSALEPGDTLELRAYWRLRHPIPPGLRVAVEVHDGKRFRLPLGERPLASGLPAPIQGWESVRSDLALRIPHRLGTGTYAVRVAVWARREERLRVWRSGWPTGQRVAAVSPVRVERRAASLPVVGQEDRDP